MTSLQLLILRTIHRHGPQSQMSLWHNAKCESFQAIDSATATLVADGFIERTPAHKNLYRFPTVNDPAYWQLTEKGQQHAALNEAACNAQQEVCLGSK
jgi:hypothetical protein